MKEAKTWCMLSALAGIASIIAGIAGHAMAAGACGLSAGGLAIVALLSIDDKEDGQ